MAINVKRINTTETASTVTIGNTQFTVDILDDMPSPHDLYDAALGACKTLTVLWYANKRGIKVEDISTRIDRDNFEERQGVYRLNATMQVTGDLTEAQVKELESVAEKCPVHKLMTVVKTEITTSMEHKK